MAYDYKQLSEMPVPELLTIAEHLGVSNTKKLEKQDLVYRIIDKQATQALAATATTTEKPKRTRVRRV